MRCRSTLQNWGPNTATGIQISVLRFHDGAMNFSTVAYNYALDARFYRPEYTSPTATVTASNTPSSSATATSSLSGGVSASSSPSGTQVR